MNGRQQSSDEPALFSPPRWRTLLFPWRKHLIAERGRNGLRAPGLRPRFKSGKSFFGIIRRASTPRSAPRETSARTSVTSSSLQSGFVRSTLSVPMHWPSLTRGHVDAGVQPEPEDDRVVGKGLADAVVARADEHAVRGQHLPAPVGVALRLAAAGWGRPARSTTRAARRRLLRRAVAHHGHEPGADAARRDRSHRRRTAPRATVLRPSLSISMSPSREAS